VAHGVQGNGEAAIASHDLCLTVGAAAVADAAGKAPLHNAGVNAQYCPGQPPQT